ncbi:hypothetical protein B0T21DRAFT_415556 [Apiosordaria backusii]|uniref:Uncharacterized protein n=1 Tax=Apiosordaria backusii TaxID=314023 RepID=A0AA40AEG0_9PEZI|nr:hypothetical protein B0T21DRAFT_415556 [Apiosordaria backusii]
MCRLPSGQSVRDMLGKSIPLDVTVTRIQPFPSLGPQRTYRIDLSDNTTLHLVLPPFSMWRPLRSEQAIVSTEATAVDWLQQVFSRYSSSSSTSSSRSSRRGSEETSKQRNEDSEILLRLLPALVQHGQDTTTALRELFAFYEPRQGTALALLDPKLPDDPHSSERQQVDLELGTFYRRLLTQPGLVSPTGRFGPLAAVIPLLQPSQPQRTQPGAGGLFGTGGAGTWSVAFHSMLEGVLRDGEDMAVVLGYSTIRRHFRRLGYLLDDVTVPKLVVVDAAQDSNLLVERIPESGGGGIRIAGLQSWSNCIFGDPLFATVFSDPPDLPPPPPSLSFLRGFNSTSSSPSSSSPSTATATAVTSDYISTLNPQIIESLPSAPVRLLFYQIYHILTRVVAEFYRPRPDSTTRELEARRKLNMVLTKLAEVPDDFLCPPADSHYASFPATPNSSTGTSTKSLNKREHGVARPSGEMSPAKRLRELELPIPKK